MGSGMTLPGAGVIIGLGGVGIGHTATAPTGPGGQGPSGVQTVEISPADRPARATTIGAQVGAMTSTHHTSLQAMTVITQIIVEGLRGILQDFGRGTHLRGLLTLLGMGIQDKRLLPTRVLSVKKWRCQASMHRVLERIWA